MTGLMRDPDTVEVDDETISELRKLGGKVLVFDSLGACCVGELARDGESFVIRLEARIERGASRAVKIKPRVSRDQTAAR
jgi:hypothetical protein